MKEGSDAFFRYRQNQSCSSALSYISTYLILLDFTSCHWLFHSRKKQRKLNHSFQLTIFECLFILSKSKPRWRHQLSFRFSVQFATDAIRNSCFNYQHHWCAGDRDRLGLSINLQWHVLQPEIHPNTPVKRLTGSQNGGCTSSKHSKAHVNKWLL